MDFSMSTELKKEVRDAPSVYYIKLFCQEDSEVKHSDLFASVDTTYTESVLT